MAQVYALKIRSMTLKQAEFIGGLNARELNQVIKLAKRNDERSISNLVDLTKTKLHFSQATLNKMLKVPSTEVRAFALNKLKYDGRPLKEL